MALSCFGSGLKLYKRNLQLLVPFLILPNVELLCLKRLPADGGPTRLRAEWTLSTTVKLPWRPFISIIGATEYTLNNDANVVIKHVESWNVSATAAVLQILRPGQRQRSQSRFTSVACLLTSWPAQSRASKPSRNGYKLDFQHGVHDAVDVYAQFSGTWHNPFGYMQDGTWGTELIESDVERPGCQHGLLALAQSFDAASSSNQCLTMGNTLVNVYHQSSARHRPLGELCSANM
eukprot:352129-Chlamydomonas_euryale.AAC.1